MYGEIPILGEPDYVYVIQNTNAKDNPSTWPKSVEVLYFDTLWHDSYIL